MTEIYIYETPKENLKPTEEYSPYDHDLYDRYENSCKNVVEKINRIIEKYLEPTVKHY